MQRGGLCLGCAAVCAAPQVRVRLDGRFIVAWATTQGPLVRGLERLQDLQDLHAAPILIVIEHAAASYLEGPAGTALCTLQPHARALLV